VEVKLWWLWGMDMVLCRYWAFWRGGGSCGEGKVLGLGDGDEDVLVFFVMLGVRVLGSVQNVQLCRVRL
jgi:hypothetical protein